MVVIDTDGAAFHPEYLGGMEPDNTEIFHVMRRVTEQISEGVISGDIHDSDGNRCGYFHLDAPA